MNFNYIVVIISEWMKKSEQWNDGKDFKMNEYEC